MFTWFGNSSTHEQQQWAAKVAEFLKVCGSFETVLSISILVLIISFILMQIIELPKLSEPLAFLGVIFLTKISYSHSYSRVLQLSIARRGQRVLLSGLPLMENRAIQAKLPLKIL
jgi:hypothetical protein